ncbi:trypsin beta-like [Bradysia coprophila]|uniref:trypsin beta-like n=1 Tax=Bradysia coprophila TaxID=38358 RepID=UPI00187D8968|nr:trypsin beta-like [Bradysia coprophila]
MKLIVVFAAIVAGAFSAENVPFSGNGLAAMLAKYGGLAPMRQGRIIGGDAVSINSFPWTLSLRRLGSHRCGAVIISANRALSAAHCTDGIDGNGFEVRAGSTQHGSGGQLISTSDVINHPQFNSETLINDICVIWLSSSLNLEPAGVSIVAMHTQGAGVAAGTTVTVAGWGATCEGCDDVASLRAVSKPVVSNAQCNAFYGGGIAAGMLCAGFPAGGRDACDGDQGGPLTMGNTLVGIVSWDRLECARPNRPGIYARVAHYRTWINSNM